MLVNVNDRQKYRVPSGVRSKRSQIFVSNETSFEDSNTLNLKHASQKTLPRF